MQELVQQPRVLLADDLGELVLRLLDELAQIEHRVHQLAVIVRVNAGDGICSTVVGVGAVSVNLARAAAGGE